MLLRSPGPISPDTYSGHIWRRALCPNRLRNGMSQRSSSSRQSDILPTMVGPSKSRPPMSHRKTDLGIPCRSKSAKVVLGRVRIKSQLVTTIWIINVRFGPLCGLKSDISRGPRSATTGLVQCSKYRLLFDHLVGAYHQGQGHFEAERLSRFQ